MADSDEGEGEELDPRVEGALGDLNRATDDINVSEKKLDDAKKAFKDTMQLMQIELKELMNKCGKRSIEKARPYHEALFKARKAHYEARQAAIQFDKAVSAQKKSKSMQTRFEGELKKLGKFNAELQQKLNKATNGVADAEARKKKSSKLHGNKTQAFLAADKTLMELAKSRKRVILKCQPYFACKDRHDRGLLAVKRSIQKHEAEVADAKARVAGSLKNLETISMEIHASREAKKESKQSKLASERPSEQAERVAEKIAEAQAETARREKEEAERKSEGDELAVLDELVEPELAEVGDGVEDDDGEDETDADADYVVAGGGAADIIMQLGDVSGETDGGGDGVEGTNAIFRLGADTEELASLAKSTEGKKVEVENEVGGRAEVEDGGQLVARARETEAEAAVPVEEQAAGDVARGVALPIRLQSTQEAAQLFVGPEAVEVAGGVAEEAALRSRHQSTQGGPLVASARGAEAEAELPEEEQALVEHAMDAVITQADNWKKPPVEIMVAGDEEAAVDEKVAISIESPDGVGKVGAGAVPEMEPTPATLDVQERKVGHDA